MPDDLLCSWEIPRFCLSVIHSGAAGAKGPSTESETVRSLLTASSVGSEERVIKGGTWMVRGVPGPREALR